MFWGKKFVISVGGGKGGIGKSCFVGNLGVMLSQMGKKVVLVDADLGAANLHTIIGIAHADKTLKDFITRRYPTLPDVLIDSPYPNLKLLSSASDVLSLSYPTYKEKQRLFSEIQKLDADVIIFDIAAGTHQRAIDFFSLAPLGIILIQPVPTSLENAFSFLKNLLVRHLTRIFYRDLETRNLIINTTDPRNADVSMELSELINKLESQSPEKIAVFRKELVDLGGRFCIIANGIKTTGQSVVTEKFAKIVRRYLTLNVTVLGNLPFEIFMDRAITERVPFIVKYPDNEFVTEMKEIVTKMLLNHTTHSTAVE